MTGDPWALPGPVLDAVAERLDELRPDLVVEAGSGRSTPVLAAHAGRVVSLEHQPRFAARTSALLDDAGNVELRFAPIVGWATPAGRLPWYDTTLPDGVGWVLLDGPPGSIGRAAGLFALAPRLEPDAEVWLDDAGRDGERRALAMWERHLGATWELHPDHPRIAVVRLD